MYVGIKDHRSIRQIYNRMLFANLLFYQSRNYISRNSKMKKPQIHETIATRSALLQV